MGETGHGIQQWLTVRNIVIVNTSTSVNASFVRLSSAHSDIHLGFPSAVLAFHPALLSCSSPLSGSPLMVHRAPKAGYCPKVKIVPWVGVLPKLKALVSLLSLPNVFVLFLLTFFFPLVFHVSYLAEAKYVRFAPVTLFVCFSLNALPFSVLLEVNFELFLLNFPSASSFQVRNPFCNRNERFYYYRKQVFLWGSSLIAIPGETYRAETEKKRSKGNDWFQTLWCMPFFPPFHCLDLMYVFLVMDPSFYPVRFAVKCTRLFNN